MKNNNMINLEFATPSTIKHVYHYQRFERNWIESLVNERNIRFSSPMDFNDPWDCKPCYNKSIVDDPVELKKHVDAFVEAHRKHCPDVSEEVRQELCREWSNPATVKGAINRSAEDTAKAIDERYKVYCVGTKPDCQLMWAHYAGSHSGICLQFSTKNDVFAGAVKVKYLEEFVPHNFLAQKDENLLPLVTKSSVWSYEEEYRLIAQESALALNDGTLMTTNNFFIIPENSLIAIIMGARIKQEDRSWLESFISRSGAKITLKAVRAAPDKYELVIGDS
jgi:Protein of unknown function (DUF2971)